VAVGYAPDASWVSAGQVSRFPGARSLNAHPISPAADREAARLTTAIDDPGFVTFRERGGLPVERSSVHLLSKIKGRNGQA
jgi:hypothetical protein